MPFFSGFVEERLINLTEICLSTGFIPVCNHFNNNWAAVVPIILKSCKIVVSAGSKKRAAWVSSKPTTARFAGICQFC